MKPYQILFLLLLGNTLHAQNPLVTGNFHHRSTIACSAKNDFSFSFNACAPSLVSFSSNATGYLSIKWDFGDGNVATGSPSVANNYISQGNYQVTLITDYAACSDTVKKTIAVSSQNDNTLITTNDTTICYGQTKQLLSNAGFGSCWSPSANLNNASSPSPIASPTQTTTYYLNSVVTGNNLISNGNFSAGNTGFSSQYFYTANNTTEGEYYVGPNPQAWYPLHFPCSDHTSGTGNMMMVNGSPGNNVEVWKTTITILPNTNYAFSTWICSISNPNPAQLAFSINGNTIGGLITAGLPTCTWNQFYTMWNSGNATTAIISVINKNTIAFGNDFALDDISFTPITIRRDSVKIIVDSPYININPSFTSCESIPIQLNASGSSNSTFSWVPTTGLSASNILNPIASLSANISYTVSATSLSGCTANANTTVLINPKPIIITSPDTTICFGSSAQLLASGGQTYNWMPDPTLSNVAISNPIATPVATKIYYVMVTGSNTCTSIDSVKVEVRATANFSISPSQNICAKDSVQLNASGGDIYSWAPASTLSNSGIPSPIATPLTTTTYSVIITDTLCGNTGNLSTTVTTLLLPNIITSKSNNIDCALSQSQLAASGATNYTWDANSSLSNINIANPIASPTVTTKYIVTGTDSNNCSNKDSITVEVNNTNSLNFLMPSAFTPNNDGLNDCFGIKYWGVVSEIEFSVYTRWGERVFFSKELSPCWSGTYKNIPQNPGIYIYMIKAKTFCDNNVFRKGTFALIR